jgi:glycosyltransferase involved in cell wall biosynthesis
MPWVDEVVIVDDGSTDGTEAVALSYGEKVRFFVSPRKKGEYYSHQRNKGVDASTSEWLLHMDIDERVPSELAMEILAAIQDRNKDAYRFKRLNFFLHKPMNGGGWQDWNNIHLARREVLRFGGMYHENHVVDVADERVGQLQSKMWHLNDSSYLERMNKSFKYCQEIARRIKSRGRKIHCYDLILYPLREFISKLIVKKGYRDKTIGVLWALHSSCAMFRSCALVWDEQNRLDRSMIEKMIKDKWRQESKKNNKEPQSVNKRI